jgi:hypothetical protein
MSVTRDAYKAETNAWAMHVLWNVVLELPEGCIVQVLCLGGSLSSGSLGDVPCANALAIPD